MDESESERDGREGKRDQANYSFLSGRTAARH